MWILHFHGSTELFRNETKPINFHPDEMEQPGMWADSHSEVHNLKYFSLNIQTLKEISILKN